VATALDLITASLQEIGVLAAGELPTTAEAADGLARLNRFLDRLAAENQTAYEITRTEATITASQASYSVGPSGNINIVRPVYIDHVNFLDTSPSPDMEYQLGDLLTEQEWQSIPMKSLTSPFPQRAYYSPTSPTGTLYPWPIPTSSTLRWVVYAWTALTQIPLITTTVALPPAYAEMIVQNLALLLCPSYEKQPHPVLVKSASDSMGVVRRANHRMSNLTFTADVPGVSPYGFRRYDIRQGP
jgi:hypothetical protein